MNFIRKGLGPSPRIRDDDDAPLLEIQVPALFIEDAFQETIKKVTRPRTADGAKSGKGRFDVVGRRNTTSNERPPLPTTFNPRVEPRDATHECESSTWSLSDFLRSTGPGDRVSPYLSSDEATPTLQSSGADDTPVLSYPPSIPDVINRETLDLDESPDLHKLQSANSELAKLLAGWPSLEEDETASGDESCDISPEHFLVDIQNKTVRRLPAPAAPSMWTVPSWPATTVKQNKKTSPSKRRAKEMTARNSIPVTPSRTQTVRRPETERANRIWAKPEDSSPASALGLTITTRQLMVPRPSPGDGRKKREAFERLRTPSPRPPLLRATPSPQSFLDPPTPSPDRNLEKVTRRHFRINMRPKTAEEQCESKPFAAKTAKHRSQGPVPRHSSKPSFWY